VVSCAGEPLLKSLRNLGCGASRDVFLDSLERTRIHYQFEALGYIVMHEHVHLQTSSRRSSVTADESPASGLFLVRSRGFAGCANVADEEDQRGSGESDPADDVKAVHEREELRLVFELGVVVERGGVSSVEGRVAMLVKVVGHGVDGLLQGEG